MAVATMDEVKVESGVDAIGLFSDGPVDCKKYIEEYEAADASGVPLARIFDDAFLDLITPLVRWVKQEEKRLGRELTNEEIDRERKDFIFHHKRADQHFKEMRPVMAELAAWEEQEELRLGRELTDDECENKCIELMAKHGVRDLE